MLSTSNSLINEKNLFFKSHQSSLYAEAVIPLNPNRLGVLFCGALAEEDFYISPVVTQLAKHLGESGFSTFKFDFFGFGNSQGQNQEGDLEIWKGNLLTAFQYFKENFEVDKIIIIAIRLGALISIEAELNKENTYGICFWDPIFNGSKYLKQKQRERIAKNIYLSIQPNENNTYEYEDFMGYKFSSKFISQLRAWSVNVQLVSRYERIKIFSSKKSVKGRQEIENILNYLDNTQNKDIHEELNCELYWLNFPSSSISIIINSTLNWVINISKY